MFGLAVMEAVSHGGCLEVVIDLDADSFEVSVGFK